MEYQVLIVEDDRKIYEMLQEELGSEYEFSRVRSVDEAIGEYESMKEAGLSFDCFIIDLAIIASGLTEQEMVDYERREGFALLKKIWEKYPNDEEYIRKRTIICSRYISDFQKEYSEDELKHLFLITKKKEFKREVKKGVNKIIIMQNNE